jgi:hypothetical protein
MITLPLTADPNRTFTTVVNNTRYQVTTRWNDRAGVWLLDLDDPSTGLNLASGIPLVLGADLLAGFAPQLGSMLVVDTNADPGLGVDAGIDDLGTRVQVFWFNPGEVTGA